MKPPKTIKVGSRIYKVSARRRDLHRTQSEIQQSVLGATMNHRLKIHLDKKAAAGVVQETLLHEVLHAVTEFTGLDDNLGESEEDFVNRLSPVLLQVLRDNPELVEYLLS
jgi:hypothetical protein